MSDGSGTGAGFCIGALRGVPLPFRLHWMLYTEFTCHHGRRTVFLYSGYLHWVRKQYLTHTPWNHFIHLHLYSPWVIVASLTYPQTFIKATERLFLIDSRLFCLFFWKHYCTVYYWHAGRVSLRLPLQRASRDFQKTSPAADRSAFVYNVKAVSKAEGALSSNLNFFFITHDEFAAKYRRWHRRSPLCVS